VTESGGKKSQVKPKVEVSFKLPPVRSKREWREMSNMKLRQLEMIGAEIMGNGRKVWGSGEF
jgi:hypothetical protein